MEEVNESEEMEQDAEQGVINEEDDCSQDEDHQVDVGPSRENSSDISKESHEVSSTDVPISSTDVLKVKGSLRAKRPSVRVKWSMKEIEAVKRQLSQCIIGNKVPRKDQAEKAIAS